MIETAGRFLPKVRSVAEPGRIKLSEMSLCPVWSHLDMKSNIVKLIEAKSRKAIARAERRENGESLFNGCRVSAQQEESAVEICCAIESLESAYDAVHWKHSLAG